MAGKRSSWSVAVVLVGLALVAGCAKDPAQGKKEPEKRVVTGHGNVPVAAPDKNAVPGTILALKGNKLAEYPQKTIGEAMESYRYFDKKGWREKRGQGGKVYIDFVGLKDHTPGGPDDGVRQRGIQVKFVIYFEGDFSIAMVSRVDVGADGKVDTYPLEDKKQVLDAIYANRELAL